MIKITGLDKMTRQLEEAQKALGELDGELGSVNFDPNDPVSIESAIQAMEDMIETKVGRYARNAIVGPMIAQMKEQYREAIIEKAAEARLRTGGE